MAHPLNIAGIPFPLYPSPSGAWQFDEQTSAVNATAAARTDIFIDPGGATPLDADSMLNAPTLLGAPQAGDFQLSARATVSFGATFDAGVLLLWIDERHWGKLCFEYSPAREPMVVSVVTRDVSDDANAFVVSGRSVWLRLSRIDQAYAYHASTDGKHWRMIRYFRITESSAGLKVGFEAQSPAGEGCTVTFEDIRFVAERLGDLRDGSLSAHIHFARGVERATAGEGRRSSQVNADTPPVTDVSAIHKTTASWTPADKNLPIRPLR